MAGEPSESTVVVELAPKCRWDELTFCEKMSSAIGASISLPGKV